MTQGPAAAWVIARKEILEHVRSKRVYIIGGLFFVTFLIATIMGSIYNDQIISWTGMGPGDDAGTSVRAVLLFYFSLGLVGGFTFVSVLAIVLSADRVCGEWKDRSLFLVLSKPVSRSGMVMGKFVGAYLSVAGVFAAVFAVCFLIIIILLGMPDAGSWGRIFGGLGVILAGLVPFVSLGILCSVLFRSPVTSFIVALGLWILVFPMISFLGFIIDIAQQGFDPGMEGTWGPLLSLFSPNSLIQTAGTVWRGENFFFDQQVGVQDNVGRALLAMAVHSVVYIGLSLFVVNRRDYA